jgi:hypothetical protein
LLLLRKIPNFRNSVTINYSSNLYSNAIDITKPVYIPNSTHSTTNISTNPTYYLIELIEELTGKVFNTLLPLTKASTNARFLTFDLFVDNTASRDGVIQLDNGGKYVYNIYAVLENEEIIATKVDATNKNARFLVDTGIAMVYEDFDFVNNYYNPDRQDIPTVTSYKNE